MILGDLTPCDAAKERIRRDMTKMRYILSLIALLAITGCKSDNPGSKIEPVQTASLPQSRKLLEISLRDIKDLCDSTANSHECTDGSTGITCNASSGRVDVFESWEIPQTDSADGDNVEFSKIGVFKPFPQWIVLMAELGHDAPAVIFWDKSRGGYIVANPENASLFFDTTSKSLIEGETTSREGSRWTYWNELDREAKKFECTLNNGYLKLDSSAQQIIAANQPADFDLGSMTSDPRIQCVEHPPAFETALPDYMRMPIR